MKTKILKLSCFALLLFTFFGCNDCSECEKENEALNEKLETCISNQQNYESNNSDLAKSSLKKYDVKGYFSINENNLLALIPVAENLLDYKQAENISSNLINALIIRVDHEDVDECSQLTEATKIISEDFLLSDYNFKEPELKRDKKIAVIIINCKENEFSSLAANYKKKIDSLNGDYTKFNTILKNGCFKEGIKKPNEDGGDIIVGG